MQNSEWQSLKEIVYVNRKITAALSSNDEAYKEGLEYAILNDLYPLFHDDLFSVEGDAMQGFYRVDKKAMEEFIDYVIDGLNDGNTAINLESLNQRYQDTLDEKDVARIIQYAHLCDALKTEDIERIMNEDDDPIP